MGAKAVLAVCFDPSRTGQVENFDFGRIDDNKGLGYDNDGENVCQCDSLYFVYQTSIVSPIILQ